MDSEAVVVQAEEGAALDVGKLTLMSQFQEREVEFLQFL